MIKFFRLFDADIAFYLKKCHSAMQKPHGRAPCGFASRLQIMLIQSEAPICLGQAGRDKGKHILRVGCRLDVIGAVHIHKIEAALGHAGEMVDIRRGIVGEAVLFFAFGHKNHLRS